MAELVDALASGASDRKIVGVRVPSSAPSMRAQEFSVALKRYLAGSPAKASESPRPGLAAALDSPALAAPRSSLRSPSRNRRRLPAQRQKIAPALQERGGSDPLARKKSPQI